MVGLVTQGQLVNASHVTGLSPQQAVQPISFRRDHPMVLQGGWSEAEPPRPPSIIEDVTNTHMFWNPEFASYRPGDLCPRGRGLNATTGPDVYAGGTTAQRLGQQVVTIGINTQRVPSPIQGQIIAATYQPIPTTAQMVSNAR